MKVLFLLGLILLTYSVVSPADTEPEKRLENVQAEIETLANELNKTKSTKATLYQQLKQQSQTVSKLNRELHDLDTQIQQQAEQLSALTTQQKQQNLSRAKQMEALNKQLRAAYLNARPNYLKVLLNQQDPADLSRISIYFRYFNQARQQELESISATLQTLANNQQQLLIAQQRQQQLYEQRQQQQQMLQKSNRKRLLTLTQLDKKMGAQGSRMVALLEQEQSLQALFESLRQAKKARPVVAPVNSNNVAFASRKGSLNWPVEGKVIARYGSSRNIGKLTWQGIMIKVPSGKDVQSAAPGRVVFSDWLRGFGLLLIIDHGDKYMTLYGNNQALLKEVGDIVGAGDLIALSGDKGIRQYAGLYFEIRHKGSPTNPAKWLSKQG